MWSCQVAVNYSRTAGKAISETLYFKSLPGEITPRPPLKTCACGARDPLLPSNNFTPATALPVHLQ